MKRLEAKILWALRDEPGRAIEIFRRLLDEGYSCSLTLMPLAIDNLLAQSMIRRIAPATYDRFDRYESKMIVEKPARRWNDKLDAWLRS